VKQADFQQRSIRCHLMPVSGARSIRCHRSPTKGRGHCRDTPPQTVVSFFCERRIATIPIPYAKRREHRLKLVEQLPPALHRKISLRNIEAFAALPDQARQTLEKAVQSGLTQIPNAIRLLKDNPLLSVEDLHTEAPGPETPAESPNTEAPGPETTPSLETPDAEALAALLRSRLPSMPETAARALAQSPSMADVLNVQIAVRQAMESPHLRSDFVLASLYGLLQSSLTQLEALIATNPAYQKALLLLLRPDPFPLAESLAAKPKN